jgi:Integrase core domain
MSLRRLRFTAPKVLTDEKAVTAVAFLRRATAFLASHGIQIERLITDNGSPYISTVHAIACRMLGIRHRRNPALSAPDQRRCSTPDCLAGSPSGDGVAGAGVSEEIVVVIGHDVQLADVLVRPGATEGD